MTQGKSAIYNIHVDIFVKLISLNFFLPIHRYACGCGRPLHMDEKYGVLSIVFHACKITINVKVVYICLYINICMHVLCNNSTDLSVSTCMLQFPEKRKICVHRFQGCKLDHFNES